MTLISLNSAINSGKDTTAKIIQIITSNKDDSDSDILQKYNERILKESISDDNTLNYDESLRNFKIKKFADKVTEIYKTITGVNYHSNTLPRVEKEKHRPTYRDMANMLKQIFGEDVWVSGLFNDYDSKAYTPKTHSGEWNCDYECYMHSSCQTCKKPYHGFKRQHICKNCVERDAPYYPNWIISDLRFLNEYQAIKARKGICVRIERNVLNEIDRGNYALLGVSSHYSETELNDITFDYTINNNGTILDLIIEVRKMLNHFNI